MVAIAQLVESRIVIPVVESSSLSSHPISYFVSLLLKSSHFKFYPQNGRLV